MTPTTTLIPWPEHWYTDDERVRCIVPNCPFVTENSHPKQQWNEICKHCKDELGCTHVLLRFMLKQTRCAIDGCEGFASHSGNRGFKLRKLFDHVKKTHNSTAMCDICPFVTLVREGRIQKYHPGVGFFADRSCQYMVYTRMLENVCDLCPLSIEQLFERSGFKDPEGRTLGNLSTILTHDPSTQAGTDTIYWRPVPAADFLRHCAPDTDNPADQDWAAVWHDLRTKYANGEI